MSLKSVTVQYLLTEAFAGRRFDICPIRSLYKMAGLSLDDAPHFPTLSALHCADWTKLPSGTAMEVFEIVAEDLRVRLSLPLTLPSETR